MSGARTTLIATASPESTAPPHDTTAPPHDTTAPPPPLDVLPLLPLDGPPPPSPLSATSPLSVTGRVSAARLDAQVVASPASSQLLSELPSLAPPCVLCSAVNIWPCGGCDEEEEDEDTCALSALLLLPCSDVPCVPVDWAALGTCASARGSASAAAAASWAWAGGSVLLSWRGCCGCSRACSGSCGCAPGFGLGRPPSFGFTSPRGNFRAPPVYIYTCTQTCIHAYTHAYMHACNVITILHTTHTHTHTLEPMRRGKSRNISKQSDIKGDFKFGQLLLKTIA